MRNNQKRKILLNQGYSMRKIFLSYLIIFASLASNQQAFAMCTTNSSCGRHLNVDGKPVHPGCESLNVIIHNTTKFKFEIKDAPDKAYTQTFGEIPAGSQKTFSIRGLYLDENNQDDVNTSITYVAKRSDGGNAGTQFKIQLKKTSCNSNSPDIIKSDYECYTACRICHLNKDWTGSDCHWSCSIGGAEAYGGETCTFSGCKEAGSDGVCSSFYNKYVDIQCNNAVNSSPSAPSSALSSVIPAAGLFTVGANFNDGGEGTGENSSVAFSTYSNFTCNKSSECGETSGSNEDCQGGTDTNNKPAKLEFYVKPSPIETLTITLPSDTRNANVKILHDAIYNNLNAKYLGQLSAYFSFPPVVSQVVNNQQTFAFSTLCNAANCP